MIFHDLRLTGAVYRFDVPTRLLYELEKSGFFSSAALALTSTAASAAPETPMAQATLGNGLRVVVVRHALAPIVDAAAPSAPLGDTLARLRRSQSYGRIRPAAADGQLGSSAGNAAVPPGPAKD